MLNATRAAAVVAVLALSGSLAVIVGPLGPSVDPVPPPAAESAVTDTDLTPGFFSGTATLGRGQVPETTALVDRLELRDAGTTFRLDLDDARVNGSTGTMTSDWDTFPITDGVVEAMRRGSGHMSNDGGSWVLTFYGAGASPEDGHSYGYATMVGEDGYEGLVGSMVMMGHDGVGGWQVTGSIVPAEHVAAD